MRHNPLILVLVFCINTFYAYSQEGKKEYITKHISSAPKIDGLLDDPCWNEVEWGNDFVQWEPEENTDPTYQTLFKILYDDKNLYVGIRALDDDPSKIERRMSRRDGFEGDWVEINIDSRGDQRTAFSFSASVSGVKGDEYVSKDGGNWDATWDPIWFLKTSIDDKGWVAEFRIPLSQLRFSNKEEHTWGLQFVRRIFNKQERSLWQFVSRNESGWVRHFGVLKGIKGIKSQKQLEIMPYVVAKTESFEAEEGNPFKTGKSSGINAGVDGKIGITSDITLDFTINPDFGQVEADPSQINLSAYRLFFEERRPFFIEGKDLFDFQPTTSRAGGAYNRNTIFYSRNIGGSPHYIPEVEEGAYVKCPDETRILTAVKLIGKSSDGFSWGALGSVTAEEQADIDLNGARRNETVEPMTSYFVGRVQQEFKKGNTVLGFIGTSTNRRIETPELDSIPKSAYSGGMDLLHHWKNRAYFLSYRASMSRVNGSSGAILNTQTAPERYFQRPDNDYVTLDSSRTSLSGWTNMITVGKLKGKLIAQTGMIFRSPGYEINDIGFLHSTDEINQWSWIQYRKLEPFSVFRELRVNANEYLYWDFGMNRKYQAININAHSLLKNFWGISAGSFTRFYKSSNTDLRGGPSIRYPGSTDFWVFVRSDSRKKFQFSMEPGILFGAKNYSHVKRLDFRVEYQPTNAMYISLAPSISVTDDELQYVTTCSYGDASRYIVGNINRKTYQMDLRINYLISPTLSIQFWGQPYISSGSYNKFKRITDPMNDDYFNRFHQFVGNEITFVRDNEDDDGQYDIDESGDGTTDYSFDNPDFNFVQFRSNLVLRWEYIPGSELFLVWTQDRTTDLPVNTQRELGPLAQGLLDQYPHNVFLLKATYRFMR